MIDTAVIEGGTPAANVTKVQLPEDTEFAIGQNYRLEGNATFIIDEYTDGGAFITQGIWTYLQDNFGCIPYYWLIDYDYEILERDGGRIKWFFRRIIVEFIPTKSPLGFAWLALLTSLSFWLGLGIAASLIIVAFLASVFVLKPAGQWGGGLGGVIVAIGLILGALILIPSILPSRKG